MKWYWYLIISAAIIAYFILPADFSNGGEVLGRIVMAIVGIAAFWIVFKFVGSKKKPQK